MRKSKTQVKFTLESELVSSFKLRCCREGVSMTSAVKELMASSRTHVGMKIKTGNRSERRRSVSVIISALKEVLGGEEQYRENIPEQFEQRRETAEEFCELLAEAVEILEGSLL